MLVDRHTDAPELSEIHRFTHEWERRASLSLRHGEIEVISTYTRQDRIREGATAEMLDAAYQAWRIDTQSGKTSVLVTESSAAVHALNERARAERLTVEAAIDGRELRLSGGARASVGDVVITRRNDRTIQTISPRRGGWVKNGDRWRITDIRPNGTVVVDRLDPRRQGRTVLPCDYVAQYLDLGYATTAHRAQGITVDTSHVVVTPSTTRENLYVSMSRGRDANIAYVALDQPDDSHTAPEPDDISARSVLYGVLKHRGASLSAHQTMEAEYELHGGIDRLAAELETIAAEAQHDRFVDLLSRSGLTTDQHASVVESTAFGPLAAALRRAEAYHHDLDNLIPRIVGQHPLDDANDIAAVLRHRIDRAAGASPRGCRLRPRLIAGLFPAPLGEMSGEDRRAIDERIALIESRARALADEAVATRPAWVRRLGEQPSGASDHEDWTYAIAAIAAYRDRYQVTEDVALGGGAVGDAQRAERQRALWATRTAAELGARDRPQHLLVTETPSTFAS